MEYEVALTRRPKPPLLLNADVLFLPSPDGGGWGRDAVR